ncbi:MAG: hypothetical protein H6867_07760 [Rhodospirillales bacterium]|nr:hypothetical protein [Rhodospirillales bacterium]MCB9995448.1 hypothetical protein [Rhodospirillales bacterium]
MAFTDYDQSQIIEQIQAFFLMQRLSNPEFLKGMDFDPVNGQLGDANSATNQAISTFLKHMGVAEDQVNPANPNYLETAHWYAGKIMARDMTAQYHLKRLEEVMDNDPESLSEEVREMYDRRIELQQQIDHANAEMDQIERDVESGARKDYGNAGKIQTARDMSIIRMERLERRLLEIKEVRDLTNDPAKRKLYETAQTLTEEGKISPAKPPAAKADAEAEQKKTVQQEQKPPPQPEMDDSSIYFINMFAMNNPNISTHTGHVWQSMKAEGLSAGDAIDKYIANYADRYKAEHDGQDISASVLKNMQNSIIGDVRHLRQVEASIQGVAPTPEMIADNFVSTRIMPKMDDATRSVYDAMNNGNLSFDDALNQYFEKREELYGQLGTQDKSKPGIAAALENNRPLSDTEKTQLTEQIKTQLLDIDTIRQGVKEYEGVTLTAEDTVSTMRASWAQHGRLPNSMDHYTDMLKQKIERYQSAEGGNLDQQTACARAAVDIRGQIDMDRGVPPHAVVNENHVYYNNDISIMEGWLRKEAYVKQGGGLSAEEARTMAGNEQDMTNLSKIDVYTQKYGAIYGLYRRSNMEEAMIGAHKQKYPEQYQDASADISVKPPAQSLAAQQLADVEQQQLMMAEDILRENGATLRNNQERLTKIGVHIETPERLVNSMRDPGVQKEFLELADTGVKFGQMSAGARDQIQNTLDRFNSLEAERQVYAAQVEAEPKPEASHNTKPQTAQTTTPTEQEWDGPDLPTLEESTVKRFDSLQDTYMDFLSSQHGVMSREQMQFMSDAHDRYEDLKDKVHNGGDMTESLKETHQFATFLRDGMDQREVSFVKDNWKQLQPYLQRIDETLGPEDFEKGRDILRANQDAIIEDTYDHRGATVRELLHDRRSFDKIEKPLNAFEEEIKQIEAIAAENKVDLETTPETPATQEITAPAADAAEIQQQAKAAATATLSN